MRLGVNPAMAIRTSSALAKFIWYGSAGPLSSTTRAVDPCSAEVRPWLEDYLRLQNVSVLHYGVCIVPLLPRDRK